MKYFMQERMEKIEDRGCVYHVGAAKNEEEVLC